MMPSAWLRPEDMLRVLHSIALSLRRNHASSGASGFAEGSIPRVVPPDLRHALSTAAVRFFDLCPSVEKDLCALAAPQAWAELLSERWRNGSRCLCFQTSGSTGVPSVHRHPHVALEEEARALTPFFAGHERVVSVMPVHHVYGYTYAIMLPRQLGIPAMHLPPLPTAAFFDALREGDTIQAFPFFWQSVLTMLQQDRHPSGIRPPANLRGITAGAPCPPQVIRSLLEQAVLTEMTEVYGSTETSVIGLRRNGEDWYSLLPVWEKNDVPGGLPSIIRIREDGTHCPAQALPDAITWWDERRFVPGSRVDKAVQVGGVNVYPDEVAAVIRTHPHVRDCVVRLMRPEEGVRLKAFIVPSIPLDADTRRLFGKTFHAWLAERLNAPARPKALTLGAQLPVNSLGKACDWDMKAV